MNFTPLATPNIPIFVILYNNERKATFMGLHYDGDDNISTISLNGVEQYHYYYNIADELIRVDDHVQMKTFAYEYDTHGNIKNKKEYTYTTETELMGEIPSSTIDYKYENDEFPDKLTNYNDQEITYDELGNSLSYLGWNMDWTAGRELSSMNIGSDTISYQYDDKGIRTSKTVNGVTTTYTTINGRITSQDDGTNKIYFRYDKNNQLVGFNRNGTEYLYELNGQGDVIGILDNSGKQLVSYKYDAWGLSTIASGTSGNDLAKINPMRYRGYYLDKETGFYYLQSRYYDPNVGRFINADEPYMMAWNDGNIVSANLFAYCINSPIMNTDYTGFIAASIISGIVGALLTVLFDIVGQYFSYYIEHKGSFSGFKLNGWSLLWSGATGFTAGILMTSTYVRMAQAVGGGVIAGLTNIVNCIINHKSFSLSSLLIDIAVGVLIGALCGDGIGLQFFKKGLFRKGHFVYKGKSYSTRNLQMVKPVFVEYAKALYKYALGIITDQTQKLVRSKL